MHGSSGSMLCQKWSRRHILTWLGVANWFQTSWPALTSVTYSFPKAEMTVMRHSFLPSSKISLIYLATSLRWSAPAYSGFSTSNWELQLRRPASFASAWPRLRALHSTREHLHHLPHSNRHLLEERQEDAGETDGKPTRITITDQVVHQATRAAIRKLHIINLIHSLIYFIKILVTLLPSLVDEILSLLSRDPRCRLNLILGYFIFISL